MISPTIQRKLKFSMSILFPTPQTILSLFLIKSVNLKIYLKIHYLCFHKLSHVDLVGDSAADQWSQFQC